MSMCTHVAGIVRLEDVRIDCANIPDFDLLFGKEVKYGDADEIWRDAYANPKKYLPLGSEGTLTKSVWINPDETEIDAYTVSIFGDLKDYDRPEDIIDWFRDICEKEDFVIRDAVIIARCEDGKLLEWHYKE